MKKVYTLLAITISFLVSIAQIPTSNLSLWLRADAGLTTSSGSNINSNWQDQSPNAISVTRQGTPLLIQNALNGKPVVRFPNTGNYFSTTNTAVTNLANITYYAVGKFSNTNSDMFYKDAQYGLYINSSSTARFYTRAFGSNELIYSNPNLVNNYFIYSGRYNGSTITGTLNTTVSSGLSFSSAMLSGGTLLIGVGNNWFTNGDIAELIIYNDALNSTQQQQVYDYLSSKYNIGIHPNAPQISNFGNFDAAFDASFLGTKVAASGFGSLGDQVTISGTNFAAVTQLFVNNISIAGFTINSNNRITFTLPDGLNYTGQDFTGKIKLVNSFGPGISSQDLQVIFSNSSPSTVINVARGGQFAIEGTDLSQITAISVGGINLPYIYNSVTKKIMVSLNTLVGIGNQTVRLRQGTVLGNKEYDLLDAINVVSSISAPTITSITPQAGGINSTFVISGTNFGASAGDNVVYMGAVQANVVSNTSTTATVQVPTGTSYDNLSLRNLNSGLQVEFSKPFVTTFLGNSSFELNTFSSPTSFNTGYYNGFFSATGDLNSDGKPEIITSHYNNNIITILQNVASNNTITSTSFQNYFILPSTSSQANQLCIKDFDNDGRLDVGVYCISGQVDIYKNISNGGTLSASSFATKVTFTMPLGGYAFDAGDIDADGKLDLVVAAFSATNTLYICKNQTTNNTIVGNSFANPVSISYGSNAYSFRMKIVDIDNDNFADVSIVNKNSSGLSTISILRNLATGTIFGSSFATPVTLNLTNTANSAAPDPALGFAWADFDNDGKLDLVASNPTQNQVSVFKNKSTVGTINNASFNERFDFPTSSNPYGVAVGDINGDGKVDIAVSSYGEAKVSLLRNQSTNGTITSASFANKQDYATTNVYNLNPIIADFDGDAKPEISTSNFYFSNLIFRNLITDPASITGFSPSSGLPLSRVTLTGSNFGDVAQVRMGTITGGAVLERNANSIVVRIPAGATTNLISLVNNSGTQATTSSNFIVTGVTPLAVITSVSPMAAPLGGTVLVGGSGFDATPSLNSIWFGATKMPVTNATTNQLTVSVTGGASSSKISYQNSFGLNEQWKLPFGYSFGGGNLTSGSFTNNALLNTGSTPYNVISHDLDGDGKPDLIATNWNNSTNQLSIYRNNSINNTINGSSFATGFGLSGYTASNSFQTSVGDLDGDGKPEILLPFYNTGFFTIFKNNSSTTTLTANSFTKNDIQVLPTGYGSYGSAIADIDNDGFNDLIFSSYLSAGIFIYRNLGNGRLDASGFQFTNFWATGGNPSKIEISDFDGDGRKDIVVGNTATTYLSVFRNNTSITGSINLATRVDLQTSNNPYGVTFADLNSDGKPEIISTNYNTSQVSVFQNNCPLTTITAASFLRMDLSSTANGNPYGIHVGDLDGDGKPEIVVTNQSVAQYAIFKNNYLSGNITSSHFSRFDINNVQFQSGVEIADLDLDGKQEIVMANTNANTLHIYKNQIGNGSIPTITGFTPTSGEALTTFVTVSGNGFTSVSGVTLGNIPAASFSVINPNTLVLRVPNTTLVGKIGVANQFGSVGLSSADFTVTGAAPVPRITNITPYSATFGTNVVITGSGFNNTPASNLVQFGAMQASVTGANTTSLNVNVPTGATFEDVRVTNLLSGLQGESFKPFVTTFPNSGTITGATFAPSVDIPADFRVYHTLLADLDNDGKNDLISANYWSNQISVFRNTGTGSNLAAQFANRQSFATGSTAYKLSTGDFDSDGRLDVIVVNYGAGSVSVLRNISSLGGISFADKVDFFVGTNPTSVEIADLDKDGALDFVVSHQNSLFFTVYKNNNITGTITSNSFGSRLDIPNDNNSYGLAVGDLDKDGLPDIAIGSQINSNIRIFKNISSGGNINFNSSVNRLSPSITYDIKIADIDGDNNLDIVSASNNSFAVSVFRNNGILNTITASSFATGVNYDVNSGVLYLALSDIDGDGKVDITATTNGIQDVSVFRNTATPGTIDASSLANRTIFKSSSTNNYIHTIGDVDGDGLPEIIVPQYNSSTINIFKNLTSPAPSITGFAPTSGQAGVDRVTLTGTALATVNRISIGGGITQNIISATNNTLVFRLPASATTSQIMAQNGFGMSSTSTGTFTISAPYPYPSISGITPIYAASGAAISISGQYFGTGAGQNVVYFGASQGTVTGFSANSVIASLPTGATYDAVTLLNRQTSLTGANYLQIPSTTFTGATTINGNTLSNRIDISTSQSSRTSSVADFDGDGRNDIVIGQSSQVIVFRNISTSNTLAGSGSFTNSTYSIGGSPREIITADIDNDGRIDIITSNQNSNSFSILKNISSGAGNIAFSTRVDVPTTQSSTNNALSVADMDLDGFMDVILYEVVTGANRITIYRNSGSVGTVTAQNFVEQYSLPLGTNSIFDIEIADLNGDNFPEIAVGFQTTSNNVYIYKNNSQAGFLNMALPTIFSTGIGSIYNLTAADFDNDGKRDLAIGHYWGTFTDLKFFRNTSTNNSISGTIFDFNHGSAIYFNTANAGDIDGDGRIDLVVTDSYSPGALKIFRNTSTAIGINQNTFAQSVSYPLFGNNGDGIVHIADLTSDGRPEIIQFSTSNNLSIWRNQISEIPTITGIAPNPAVAGVSQLTITGTGLQNTFSALFANGASVTSISGSTPTSVVVRLPALAQTGVVSITNITGGLATSPQVLTITAFPYPTITSIIPNRAEVGNAIVINGNNFDPTPSNNTVYFGGVKAAITSATISTLGVNVPQSADYDNIKVINNVNKLTSEFGFDFTPTFTGMTTILSSIYATKVDPALFSNSDRVMTGDLDGDGKLDLVTGSSSSSFVSIYRNTSNAGTWTGTSLATRIDLNIGFSSIRDIELADFDLDGRLDIVVLEGGSNNIIVLKNNSSVGNIVFSATPSATLPAGASVYSLAVADFDLDGNTDIAAGGYFSANIFIFKNLGIVNTITNSSFASPVSFNYSWGYSADLDAGDLNGDGYPDLVSANGIGYNNFTIFENRGLRGSLAFRTPVDYNTTQPFGVKIADLDNDGRLDILVSNINTNISIYKNNLVNTTITTTSFGNAGVGVTYSANSANRGVDVADMDGDGLADILVSNFNNPGSVSMYRNRGGSISGTSFSPKVDVTTGISPYGIQAVDMDGDGRTDIVSSNTSSNNLSIIRNNLSTFPTATGFNPTTATAFNIISIAGFNLNSINQVRFGTGSTALITILGATSILAQVPLNATSGQVIVTNSQGVSSTAPGVFTMIPVAFPTITGINPLSATLGDAIQINGNNFSTILGNNQVFLGAVVATVTSAAVNQLTVTVPPSADYGLISVLNRESNLQANYSIPLRNTFGGSGTIIGSSFANAVNFTGVLNSPYFSFQKDLNGDGKPEILVGNSTGSYITIFVNNASGNTVTGTTFSSFNISMPFGYSIHINADDLDNDGKPDLVVVDYTNGRVAVLKNNYAGGALTAAAFGTPFLFTTGTNPHTAAIGDVDFDGFNDIVIANATSNNISVFKNNATLGVINANSFAAKQDFTVATTPVEVLLSDLDNDGRLDIVSSNESGNSLSILKNITSRGIVNAGSFASVVNYTTPYTGYGLGIGDFNNDGKPDILSASRTNAFVMLFQNNTTGNTITGTSFSRTDIAAPVYSYRNAKIADFDGDGKNDFTVPTGFNQISVYRNVSTGVGLNVNSFAASVNYATQNWPWGLSVGDLDGDFKPEIVSVNQNSSSISVFKNLQTSANPVITSFNPSSLLQGQPFTVNGSNFAGITSLQVNGVNSPFSIINASLIVATVTGNGTTGLISVNGFNGSAVSATNLIVIPILIPTITGFNPTSALPNAVVSVFGNNFVSITGISISGVNSQFSIVNSQLITITVPSAITGKASIINYSGQTQSLSNLHIITNAGADFGRMAFFDGINNYVTIPNAGNTLESTNFTFEAMIKRSRISAPNGQDRLLMSSNFNGLGVYFENNRLTFGKIGVSQVSTNNPISDTVWHHVAVSYNGSVAKFYYDGIFDSQQAFTQTFNSSNGTYSIGSRSSSEYFQGRIDEVRIWNVERTITGIQANKCAEINGTEPNLVAYYRFNENANSTSVTDASPSGLHATALNFTLPAERPISTAKCYQAATVSGLSPNPIVGNGANILTLTGTGFTDILAVRLGNLNLPNFTVSGNTIAVLIPTTVTNTNIIVVNGTETSTSTGILTVTGLIPTFTSITPNAERRGRTITLSGTNYNNISFFGLGNTNSQFSILNSQLIIATVPGNASIGAGVLTITNLAGNGFSNFTVSGTPSPSVTGVSPAAAINGNTISVSLDEIEFLQSPITIGGTTLTNFTLSGNNLSFEVPLSATTGHVRVRSLYGGVSPTVAGSLLTILPPPSISDFGAVATGAKLASSGCGGLGELVTITGNGFSAGTTDVTMNNFNVLNPTVTSLNMIVLRVPDLSGSPAQNLTGKFKITTPAGSITSIQNMVARFCAATPTTTLGIKNGDDFEVTGNDMINVSAVSVAGISASFNTNANKLTVIVPNNAPSGFVPVSIAQGSYLFTFPFNFFIFPKPTISGILGSPALIGSTISITGFALTSTSGIAFNGANQTVVSNMNDNLVTLVVPVGAQNGNLSLTAAGGTAVSPTPFIVAPSISGVNPTAAGVGQSVSLTGSGLAAVSQVFINGMLASISSKTATRIIISVPNGATSGDLTARITGYTTPGIFFRVIPAPTITDIQPASAIAGTILTISGTGFSASGINTLSFNNTGSATGTIIGDNLMLVEVVENASSGYITLSNLGGNTTSSIQFLAQPSLTGNFNPLGMGAGATITIFGKNLFNPTLVTFDNNIATSFSYQSPTHIIAVIPNISSLTPLQVKVTTDGGTSNVVLYTIAGAPSISSITPGSGKMGDVITVNGDNFSLTSNTVLVNGANANHVALSKTVMLVTVPGNCTQATGNIQVQNVGNQFLSAPNNFANSPSNFAVIPSFTAIRNICDLSSVTSAVQGALLRIEGANFITGNTQVFFNTGLGNISTGFGICSGQFTSFSNGLAFVWVPNTATTGNVTVKTNGGTSSPIFLTIIPPPIISGFSPLSGVAGTVITISGSEFYTVSGIAVNNIAAPFTQLSQTSIVATITGTMSKGKVSMTATGGSASSNVDFAPTPVITSISPTEAPVNSFIDLIGTNLYGASNINFAGNNATNWTDGLTSTSVRVPINAVSGIISYTNAGGTAVSPIAFTVSTILGMSTNTGVAGTLITLTGNGLTSASNFSFNSTSQFPVITTVLGGVVVSVPGAATFGAITLHFPNGGSTSFGQFRPTPVITSISPNTHGTDQFVQINGTNVWDMIGADFGGVTSNNLGFNTGSNAALIVSRNNVKVPTNGLTGLVTITVAGGGIATSPSTFTVISISGVMPGTVLGGDMITISGANLDNASEVNIGGLASQFSILNSQLITATVPNNISNAQIIVFKGGGFNDSFSLNLPNASISGITPSSGPIGTIITINGANFTAARGVQLYNPLYTPFAYAINYQVISPTRMVATVTGNGISGNVRVIGQNNTIASGPLFTMPPVLNTLPNPGVLPAGQTVVLNGGNLTAPTTINVGGINVPVTNYGANSISFVMPTLVGNNILTVGNSAGVSTVNFGFLSITSISTTSGFAGNTVSIVGTGFFNVGNTTISVGNTKFNAVTSIFSVESPTIIVATTPANAGNGKISVEVGGYSVESPVSFFPRPVITGFTVINGVDATTARLGSTVSVIGTNLNNVNSITLGGSTNAYSFTLGCTTGNDGLSLFPLCVPNNANSGIIFASNGTFTATFAGFNFLAPPGTISGVAAVPGNQVTINGANLNSVTGVGFDGNEALAFTQLSPTQLTAIVPFTATLSGTTQVRTLGGNTSSSYTAPPIITALSKTQGAVGIGLNVSAMNISGINQVIFPVGITATGTNFSNNISVNVPAGATNGFVAIRNEAGLGTSPINFDVLPMPTISGISPSNGGEGTTVLINGTNLDLITGVFFGNGLQSATFTVISPTQIQATAPTGVLTGAIHITNNAIYPTSIISPTTFIGSPVFTSVINTSNGNAPYIGRAGESIQINGANFTSPFKVFFNGTQAITTNFVNASQVTAVVPVGATSGLINVSTTGGDFQTNESFSVVNFVNAPVAIITNSCAGQTFRVNYTVSGIFPADNVFYVDIMNGATLAVTSVGTRTANNSGFVSAIIPSGLAGNYTARIRASSALKNYGLTSTGSNTFAITNINNWLGYTNNWSTFTNWGCGVLPTSQSYVTIDNSPIGGNQPTIFGSATAGTVEVNGGQLTMTSAGILTFFNDLKLSSTAAYQAHPTSFTLINGANATVVSAVGHAEVGNITIGTSSKLTLGSPLKVKGSFVNNVNTSYYASYYYGWYFIYGFNSNGHAVTVEGSNFQTVGNPGFYATLFDELVLNNNTSGAGVALAGPVQVKCKLINYGIFNANNFLTEFVNGPCSPQLIAQSPNTTFDNIVFNNTLTAVNITRPIRVRGNFTRATGALGVTMPSGSAIEFVGTSAPQMIESAGQPLQFNDFKIDNPLGVTLSTTPGSDLQISGNFINNGSFTDATNTVSFSGANVTIGGTGEFNLNKVELTPTSTVTLKRSVRVRGFFKSKGGFDAGGQTITFNAPSGVQTIESTNPARLSGIEIVSTSVVTTSSNININGNFDNAGKFVATGNTGFDGTSLKTIAGTGLYEFANVSVTNAGVNIASSVAISGDLTTNGALTSATNTELTFAGTNTNISGNTEPQLANININTSAGVTLNRGVRVRGNFKSKGTLTPNNQTVTFDANGGQTIESPKLVSFSGVNITPTAQVITSAPLALDGSLTNAGLYSTNQPTVLNGSGAQTIAGTGSFNFQSISNNNSSATDSVKVLAPIQLSGNLANNGKLFSSSDIQFNGSTQTISGTVEPVLTNLELAPSASVALTRSVRVRGNFKNNSATNGLQASAPVTLEGNSVQSITGTASTIFADLNMNNNAGIVATQPLEVSKINIQKRGRVVVPNASPLVVSSTANNAITRTDSGYVVGAIQRSMSSPSGEYLFPVGNDTQYRGATITFAGAASGVGSIAVQPKDGMPTNTPNQSTVLDTTLQKAGLESVLPIYWNVDATSITGGNYNIAFDAKIPTGTINATSGLEIVKRHTPADKWELVGNSGGVSFINNQLSISRTSLTGFSQFAVAGSCKNVSNLASVKPVLSTIAGPALIGDTLVSDITGDKYQWSRNGVFITGVSTRKYKPTRTGDYRVRVVQGGCFSAFSEPKNYTFLVGTDNINFKSNKAICNLYPNPASNTVFIEIDGLEATKYKIEIADIIGKTHITQNFIANAAGFLKEKIDISSLKNGIYFVNITYMNQNKVLKLVVE